MVPKRALHRSLPTVLLLKNLDLENATNWQRPYLLRYARSWQATCWRVWVPGPLTVRSLWSCASPKTSDQVGNPGLAKDWMRCGRTCVHGCFSSRLVSLRHSPLDRCTHGWGSRPRCLPDWLPCCSSCWAPTSSAPRVPSEPQSAMWHASFPWTPRRSPNCLA